MNPIPQRNEIEANDSWDLSALFNKEEDWENACAKLEGDIKQLKDFQGKLASSPENLQRALVTYLELSKLLEKIYAYSSLKSDEDTSDASRFSLKSKALDLYTKFASATSFIRPELLEIDETILNKLLENESLAPYRRLLNEMVKYRPHTLSLSEEKLLASAGDIFRSSETIFSQLNNADFKFKDVKKEGKNLPLTHGTFVTFLQDPNRSVRKEAFENFYETIDNHKNSLSAMLASSIKKNIFLAKSRKFNGPRESALFSDDIPLAVYDSLIENVSKKLDPLHRYYKLRAERLKLPVIDIYDTYCPLVEKIDTEIPYDEAKSILCEAFLPLGEEYVDTLSKGLGEKRWVDRYENRGKRSGAYARPCYGNQQYILMNYKSNQLNDLFTLAHEAGHAMHSWYSQKHQSYQDYSYTIFVAEVASTFNEQLLLDYLKKKYSDDKSMLQFLLNHHLDDIKGTFFRQTMFAEFERDIHLKAQEGKPLNREVFCELYLSLLQKYFGPSLEFSSLAELECFRIPHFYSAFYVYQYATGLAAAVSLSKDVLLGDQEACRRYLQFLSSGCSKSSLNLLKEAGVDMLNPKAVIDTTDLFTSLLSETEQAFN